MTDMRSPALPRCAFESGNDAIHLGQDAAAVEDDNEVWKEASADRISMTSQRPTAGQRGTLMQKHAGPSFATWFVRTWAGEPTVCQCQVSCHERGKYVCICAEGGREVSPAACNPLLDVSSDRPSASRPPPKRAVSKRREHTACMRQSCGFPGASAGPCSARPRRRIVCR